MEYFLMVGFMTSIALVFFLIWWLRLCYDACLYSDSFDTFGQDTFFGIIVCALGFFFVAGFVTSTYFIGYPIVVLLNFLFPLMAIMGLYENVFKRGSRIYILGAAGSLLMFWVAYKYSTDWFWSLIPLLK